MGRTEKMGPFDFPSLDLVEFSLGKSESWMVLESERDAV